MRYQPHHMILTLTALILSLDITASTAQSLDENANLAANAGASTNSNAVIARGTEQLRDFLAGDLPGLGTASDRAALRNFYEQRNFVPFWTRDEKPTAKAQQAA